MNSDFKELLEILEEKKVRYLVVGGYAVIKYTEPRYTKDIDILIDRSQENTIKLLDALRKFGAPMLDGISSKDFQNENVFYQIGIAPNRIDIITDIAGINFNEAYQRKTTTNIEGTEVPFIGIEDLISAKLSAGRPQDLVDAGALAKVKNKI